MDCRRCRSASKASEKEKNPLCCGCWWGACGQLLRKERDDEKRAPGRGTPDLLNSYVNIYHRVPILLLQDSYRVWIKLYLGWLHRAWFIARPQIGTPRNPRNFKVDLLLHRRFTHKCANMVVSCWFIVFCFFQARVRGPGGKPTKIKNGKVYWHIYR